MAKPDLRLHTTPPATPTEVAAYLRLLAELRDAAQAHDRAGARYMVKRGLGRPDTDPHSPEEIALMRAWGEARRDLDAVWRRVEAFEQEHNRFAILRAAEAMVGEGQARG